MRKGIVFFSAVLALGAFLFLFPIRVLTLSQSGEQILFSKKVDHGDTFQLAYLHSVALSEVREFFAIDSQYRIVLVETRFQGQGAGLPFNIAEGEKLHREGDWFRLTGMKRVVPSIYWRVQEKWHNRFRFGTDPEINFSSRLEDALVHVQVQKINLLRWLRYRLTLRTGANS